MKAIRWVGDLLFPLLLIVWLNGALLRFTLRDSIDALAPLYYATPWPVLGFLTLPMVWKFRRMPKMFFVAIVLTHVFFGLWLMQDWHASRVPSREPSDLRAALWNVSRPVGRFSAVEKQLRAFDADVLAIAEALPRSGEGAARWRAAFSDHSVEFVPGNMLLLVKGEVTARESGWLGVASYYARFDVRIKGRDLCVLQADISGVPTQSRREALTKLAELADSRRDRPVLVLGDFNTPRSSVHLKALRKNFVNTFEEAGVGSGETWPMPLPVLSLDQMWCGPGLKPVRNRHETSFRSDHRAVVADLRFGD